MARQPRKHSSTGIYHVVIRGINMRRIFEDVMDADREPPFVYIEDQTAALNDFFSE